LASGYIITCLFKSAARLRINEARFTVQDIDFTLCTHYVYGYARVDVSRNTISSMEPDIEEGPSGLYRHFNSAKEKLKSIKTLLSVGGSAASSDADFHALPDSDTDLLQFSENALAFVKQNHFDGLDVDWQYPDNPAMKRKLGRLLQALRRLIGNEPILLTATCPGFSSKVTKGFNVPEIEKNVDFAFVKGFDLVYSVMLHATFSSPLYHDQHMSQLPFLNVNYSIHNWHNLGMPYRKMVLGVTAVGRVVKLYNMSRTSPNSPIDTRVLRLEVCMGYIPAGPTQRLVCLHMSSSKQFFDNVQKNPYLVSGDLWVGYENERSLEEKIKFLRRLNMAGVYFSSLDEDDFSGKICKSGRFPLLSHIKRVLESEGDTTTYPDIPTWYQLRKKYILLTVLYIVGFAIGVVFIVFRRNKFSHNRR
ncbi:unnamed protein product, partial [Candidula unifasciata]